MMKLRRAATLAVLGVAAVITAGTVAFAVIPAANGTISGCYNANGVLRVIDAEAGATCTKGETAITWNQQGAPGTPGPQGETGPQGPAGPAGSTELYFTRLQFTQHDTIERFLSLQLPAGTYLVTGKTYITSQPYGGCNLVSGEEAFQTYHDGAHWDNLTASQAAVMIDRITLTQPAEVAIRCGNGFGETWYASDSVLTAVPAT